MASAFHRFLLHFLRLMALGVLVLGLLAKPVMVAACEMDDLRLAQGGAHTFVGPAGDKSGGECCPGQACGECCTAASVLPVTDGAMPATPPAAPPLATACVESESAALPVAVRPPIAV